VDAIGAFRRTRNSKCASGLASAFATVDIVVCILELDIQTWRVRIILSFCQIIGWQSAYGRVKGCGFTGFVATFAEIHVIPRDNEFGSERRRIKSVKNASIIIPSVKTLARITTRGVIEILIVDCVVKRVIERCFIDFSPDVSNARTAAVARRV